MSDVITLQEGGTTVRIEGLGTVMRKLRRVEADANDQKDLMHKLGMIVVNAADAPQLTGGLASTIRAGRGKSKAVVRAGNARRPYAGVIHYGWPAHNIKAQPFLTDALKSQHDRIYAALEDGINQLIKDATGE